MKKSRILSLLLPALLAIMLSIACDSPEVPGPSGDISGSDGYSAEQGRDDTSFSEAAGNEPAPQINDADLEKAATAHAEIQLINQRMQQAVIQTDDPTERQELQTQASRSITEAIERAGLDFESYERIMWHVRTNDELREWFYQNHPTGQ